MRTACTNGTGAETRSERTKEAEIRSAIAEGWEIGPNCQYTREMQTDLSPARLAEMWDLAEQYAMLQRKDLLASSRPGKPVPPDPPLP